MKIILCEKKITVFISVIVLYKKLWSSSFNQESNRFQLLFFQGI